VRSDKRKDQRIHTAFPVLLENATGITRDVSASGVFFWTAGECAPGERISFAVEISRTVGRVTLECQGEIVRTEPYDAMVGVAVRLTESAMKRL
jgi:PilZ domain